MLGLHLQRRHQLDEVERQPGRDVAVLVPGHVEPHLVGPGLHPDALDRDLLGQPGRCPRHGGIDWCAVPRAVDEEVDVAVRVVGAGRDRRVEPVGARPRGVDGDREVELGVPAGRVQHLVAGETRPRFPGDLDVAGRSRILQLLGLRRRRLWRGDEHRRHVEGVGLRLRRELVRVVEAAHVQRVETGAQVRRRDDRRGAVGAGDPAAVGAEDLRVVAVVRRRVPLGAGTVERVREADEVRGAVGLEREGARHVARSAPVVLRVVVTGDGRHLGDRRGPGLEPRPGGPLAVPLVVRRIAGVDVLGGDAVGVPVRNEEACFESSLIAIKFAQKYNSRLHILHISTEKELQLFSNMKPLKEKRITAEVCVHHLHFTADDYEQLGYKIKCNPAIKAAHNKEALWKALLDDRLDVIATDHAPHTWEEKQGPYEQAHAGLPLVQHPLLLMLHYHKEGRISLEKIAEKMSHAVADCFQIEEQGLYTGRIFCRPGGG